MLAVSDAQNIVCRPPALQLGWSIAARTSNIQWPYRKTVRTSPIFSIASSIADAIAPGPYSFLDSHANSASGPFLTCRSDPCLLWWAYQDLRWDPSLAPWTLPVKRARHSGSRHKSTAWHRRALIIRQFASFPDRPSPTEPRD